MQAIPRAVGPALVAARFKRRWKWHVAALAALAVTAGCTRAYYHDYADRDVYNILKERLFDWRWKVPERPVEAPPISRMADLNDPNHEALVTDDVARGISRSRRVFRLSTTAGRSAASPRSKT